MKIIIFLLLTSMPVFAQQLQGTVRDRDTQTPIEGAIVRIQKEEAFTTTNSSGAFTLDNTTGFPLIVTAAKFNYFNGYTQLIADGEIVIEMDGISLDVDPSHPLNAPVHCNECHVDQYDEWLNSPMGKTGMNTWVFDMWNGTGTAGGMNGFVYQRDSTHRIAKPNSDCAACHNPIHWLADPQNNGLGDLTNPTQNQELGVQCEICHRTYDVDSNNRSFPGLHPQSVTILRGPQNLEFGRLGDSIYENQIMRPAYNPLLSAQLCSACHEDSVDVDDDGDHTDEGSVPHQTTYTDWLEYTQLPGSEAKTCIECHMPTTNKTQFCIWETEDRRPDTIRYHNIRGTSSEFLENAVTMTADHDQDFNTLTVNVSVLNDRTGHTMPTGITARNAILVVQVTDDTGQPLTQTGGGMVDMLGGMGDPADGNYAGLAGKSFYLSMTDGAMAPVVYTEAIAIAADTRIRPGATYQDAFIFDLGADPTRNMNVDVRLIFRRFFKMMVDMKGWTLTGRGEPLPDVTPPHYGHLMERAQLIVDVCANKDLNSSSSVDMDDLLALNPLWGEAAPFWTDTDPITNVKHFVSLVNCL